MSRPNARGYVRVSTAMQAEEGESLLTQTKRIQGHCEYKGYNLVKIYQDAGISAKDTNRPSLQQLMKDVERGDVVLIAELSRLSRNTRDALNLFEEFKEKGVNFVCLSPDIDFGTPVGSLLMTLLMAVHQLERQNISAHVKANMQRLSKEGTLRSRPPFGYRFVSKDRDFEPILEQIAVKDKIIEMHRDGKNLSQIAKTLNDAKDNVVLKANKKTQSDKDPIFYPQTIKRILIDYGVIPAEGSCADRAPVDQRIISYRKAESKASEPKPSETKS